MLGSGTLTGATGGEFIYTIDLIPVGGSSGDTIDIEAGEDIVIFYSRTASGGFHLGKATTSFTNDAIGQKVASPQIVEADLVDSISTVIANSDAGESTNVSVPRLGCHFYEGTSSDPVQRFRYVKCQNINPEGACLNMPAEVIYEAPQSELLDYMIFRDVNAKENECCYIKVDESELTVTAGIEYNGTFDNCDGENLPAVCTEE